MSKALSQRTHYPALDGLRGVAILLVIAYHNFGLIPFFNYGWLGVDLFFVLSGFLITEILLGSRDAGNYFRNFYIKRILRIFPLYYLTLILIIIILPAIKSFPFSFEFYIKHQAWFWLYLENWLLILGEWKHNTFVLNHFWSLAVEEQFYLIWPLVLLMIRRPKHLLWLCLAVLLLVIFARFYVWYHKDLYPGYLNIFLFTRIDGILIGSMLALTKRINYDLLKKYSYVIILGLAAINFIFYFVNEYKDFTFPYWGIVGYSTFAVMFALLAYEAIDEKEKVLIYFLNAPFLRFLGKISYGFYVFHWPVYLMLYPYTARLIKDLFRLSEINGYVLNSFMLTIAGFLISVISYYTFEKYFLNLKKKYN